MQTIKISNWIRSKKKKNWMRISNINFKDMEKWILNQSKIYNKKKNFFSIVPYQFTINKKKKIYQPLIIQKEVGILGIIKKKINSIDHYLLQAKIEPGNVNNVQLSPTVQATRSNYLRKHGGKKTNYLEFFTKKRSGTTVLNKTKLSEQGTRYFEKFNKNILIDIKKKKLNKYSNYIWVNKQNLIQAVKKKNFLNMDTISVFSNSIKRNRIDNPKNNTKKILKKLIYFKRKNKISKKKIFFKDLKNWVLSKNKIFDSKKLFFSILALKINTNSREVKKWHQPIISDHSMSFNGFFLKKINNTNHYLLQMVQEPGFNLPKFTSTVCIKNFSKKNIYSKNYISRFNDKKNFKMDIINSDEGGRFYRNEIRNVICEIKINQKFNLKSNYIWASHNQIIDLIRRNLLSIEARNLFACFNIDKIK